MRLKGRFWSQWIADDRGAATADLVVLTSCVALFGIATVWGILGAGVSRAVDNVAAGVTGSAQPDAGSQGGAAKRENEAASPAADAVDAAAPAQEVEQGSAAAEPASEGQEGPDDAPSVKSNNGKSEAARDNPGKHLAKGAAK